MEKLLKKNQPFLYTLIKKKLKRTDFVIMKMKLSVRSIGFIFNRLRLIEDRFAREIRQGRRKLSAAQDRRLRLLYWLVRVALIKRCNYPGKILSEISVINFSL